MASYIPSTAEERAQMLEALGLPDVEALYHDVPDSVLMKTFDAIPKGKSQLEVEQLLREMAGRNHVFATVLRGAGIYDHYIPAIVDSVTAKEAFSTAYTPYQAEISQGILQSIFEFQTMICELTGMDVSNASVYDGASAAAEAAMMCLKRNKNRILVAATANPETIATVKTYGWGRDVQVELIPMKDGRVDMQAFAAMLGDDVACAFVQQPNFYGLLEDVDALARMTHDVKAKVIMGAHPLSLTVLRSPREYGADIATGDGQALGMPMAFGGPTVGFMACTQEMARSLPGRIVGQTEDAKGNRAFVLTLQAREQHIRREKAGSNICSNQALCALRAGVYMAAMGLKGMRQAAMLCYNKAHYFLQALENVPGVKRVYQGDFFNEFVTTLPIEAGKAERELIKRDILPGLVLQDGTMLWCVTEKVTKAQLDEAVQALKEVARR